jgi:tetratricopeptide (TPR) repeat protein
MDAIKEAHYNLGIAYLEAGQYDRAVPEFEAAIKLDADFIGAHCALCRAYLEQNELEKASTSVRAALKLDATHQPALLLCDTLTQAYYNKGKDHLDAERYTEAVSTFQKALTLNADLGRSSQVSDIENKHIYAHLGVAYIRLEAYQEAIDALQNAIALDADLVDAHYYLGYAYVEQGSHDKAIPHLERAIAIAPNLKRAHYNLARAYRESGNLEAATHAVTETLRLDPNYQRAHELANSIKQAHYNRGITYLNDERYSEAVTAFQNAITLDPDFTTAHYNLGLTYLKMETYPRAVDALQKTITLDRTYKAAHHSLALAYLGQQELGKAREAAREVLKLDANYQPARSLLEAIDPGFTPPETQTTPPLETEEPVNQQITPKPRQETHYELGIAYKNSKMYTEAIAEFQKAIDLDPDFVAAHVSLGEVYLEMGQFDEAETAVSAALRIDANSEPARQLLDAIRQTHSPAPRPTESTEPVSPPSVDASDVNKDLERGLVFLNNGQYPQAAAAFKRVIKADPSSIEAHYGLGQAYLEIGAFDDAKSATEEALKRNPFHQPARELLQVIQFAKNREKNRKIRKKVLKYAAVFGVIAVGTFVLIKLCIIPGPWCNGPIPPDLSISVSLEEPSGNGFLDAGETGRIRLTINNRGGTARNVELRFEPPSIAGLRFSRPTIIPELRQNSVETIRIRITADQRIQGRDQALEIQLFGENRTLLATKNFSFTIIPPTPDPIPPRR